MWKKNKQILQQITLFLPFLFKEPWKSRKYKKTTQTAAIRGVSEGPTARTPSPQCRTGAGPPRGRLLPSSMARTSESPGGGTLASAL